MEIVLCEAHQAFRNINEITGLWTKIWFLLVQCGENPFLNVWTEKDCSLPIFSSANDCYIFAKHFLRLFLLALYSSREVPVYVF